VQGMSSLLRKRLTMESLRTGNRVGGEQGANATTGRFEVEDEHGVTMLTLGFTGPAHIEAPRSLVKATKPRRQRPDANKPYWK
jgi:hypothetical protein